MLFIGNGTVFPMDGAPIEDGAVLIENGKIAGVGRRADFPTEVRAAESRIDAEGGWITPGLVESHCHVGITEDSKGMALDGCNEAYKPVTPHLSALDGINPADKAFTDAVRAGITTVMIGPGSSNVVGGRFVAVKTYGRVIDDMALLSPAAMKVAFGENPLSTYGALKTLPSTRMSIAGVLREELFKAQEYLREKAEAAREKKPFTRQFAYECWQPVFEKKIPLKAHAHRADDIMTALRIAGEFGLDVTLDHCTEGHLIADRIREAGAPAIVGPYESFRNKVELENLTFSTARRLHRAGVLFSICTDHPVCLIQSLPLVAGLAVREGLPLLEGLAAVTINAAKILRVDHRVGALKAGLDADVAVYSGNPMETFTKTLYTVVDGKIAYSYQEEPHVRNQIL